MTDSENPPNCILSSAIKCSEWSFDHTFMHCASSPDGRFVYKWNFVSFLVIDTFYGQSRKFSSKNKLRIRDFLSLSHTTGLLLYSQDGKVFISLLKFDFSSSNAYELLKPEEIVDDIREYGGNITQKDDEPNKFVVFLTRNCPGDIFIFFELDKSQQISFELTIETEEREYAGFGFYSLNYFYYYRMAYGGGERPFEALKVLEKRENAKPQTVYFGPMPLMNRRQLMSNCLQSLFKNNLIKKYFKSESEVLTTYLIIASDTDARTWNSGTFYLSVNINPHQYFSTLNLQTLKWTTLEFASIQFEDPRIYINENKILIVHDESKIDGSANRVVKTYRIPLEEPESLQLLSFFQISKNNSYKSHQLQLPLNSSIKPVFTD